ncbi:outer membrane protein assembly factor BamC [Neiella marina]|uniref:Outer membrane protein assembly factor BamC n=1 Tax=Neiella holothuriorum TaxID=2870530 RepID=A0ABS7EIL2_9GAMM|nr:outer membrane protein assembly factor BamC [Neiella holothuriorum]MBW8192192.1 outer membrane protein assembly factor BamC [Neiella holothuriorum]
MRTLVFGALAGSLLLAGCAGNENRARSDYEYVDAKSDPVFVVPEDLEAPPKRPDYHIPEIETTDETAIGENLVISAPIQVLTLVDGSLRPQGEDRRASIEFDITRYESENPIDGIWKSLWNVLERNDIAARFWDKEEGVLVTDWFVADSEEAPSYFFGIEDYFIERTGKLEVRARYAFNLDVSRTGRTAKLSAVMVGFERYLDKTMERNRPTQVERDNFTVNVLNGVVKQYQNDMIALKQEKTIEQQRAMALSMQVDQKGLASIVAAVPFDQAWENAESLLEAAGFVVEDRERMQATYYVTVPGNWNLNHLFSETKEVGIKSGDYKLFFGDRGDTTTISIFNDDNKPLKEEDVAKAYESLQQALKSLTE